MWHAEADAGGWSQTKAAWCELGCFICLRQLRATWLANGKLIKASSRLHTSGVVEGGWSDGVEAALAHKRPITRCDVEAAITSVRIFHAHRDVPRTNTFVHTHEHTHIHTCSRTSLAAHM